MELQKQVGIEIVKRRKELGISQAIVKHLSDIGYILFHTRKDEWQHLYAVNGDISVVEKAELGTNIYPNISTTDMYAMVPFEPIELDSKGIHSSKKSWTLKTRYDTQFAELRDL